MKLCRVMSRDMRRHQLEKFLSLSRDTISTCANNPTGCVNMYNDLHVAPCHAMPHDQIWTNPICVTWENGATRFRCSRKLTLKLGLHEIGFYRGKFFFPDKSPQVRSVKCSALSHIKSADLVKIGTPSACFPLRGKHADLILILVRPFSCKGKRTDFFLFWNLFLVRKISSLLPTIGKIYGP
jgi:hypothetical protein